MRRHNKSWCQTGCNFLKKVSEPAWILVLLKLRLGLQNRVSRVRAFVPLPHLEFKARHHTRCCALSFFSAIFLPIIIRFLLVLPRCLRYFYVNSYVKPCDEAIWRNYLAKLYMMKKISLSNKPCSLWCKNRLRALQTVFLLSHDDPNALVHQCVQIRLSVLRHIG